MDYKKLICRRILDLDPQYDIKKLENSSKQEVENILRRKKQESPKEKVAEIKTTGLFIRMKSDYFGNSMKASFTHVCHSMENRFFR